MGIYIMSTDFIGVLVWDTIDTELFSRLSFGSLVITYYMLLIFYAPRMKIQKRLVFVLSLTVLGIKTLIFIIIFEL